MNDLITVIHDKDYGSLVCGIPINEQIGMQYTLGKIKPNHPMPTISCCLWCAAPIAEDMICLFNDTGEWCPDMCFCY